MSLCRLIGVRVACDSFRRVRGLGRGVDAVGGEVETAGAGGGVRGRDRPAA